MSALSRDYSIEEYLSEASRTGTIRSVHLEAGFLGPDPVEETRWLQAVADGPGKGFPHAFVVLCDLRVAGAERQLERHLAFANTRGVRARYDFDPASRIFQTNVGLLAHYGLSLEFSLRPDGLPAAVTTASMHPDVKFVVGHAGMPLRFDAVHRPEWHRVMAQLSALPNVWVKVSGLGMADHTWTAGSVRSWVLDLIDLFGVGRCMFGTNWPVDALFRSYTAMVKEYRHLAAPFSPEEGIALLCTNARDFYRI